MDVHETRRRFIEMVTDALRLSGNDLTEDERRASTGSIQRNSTRRSSST